MPDQADGTLRGGVRGELLTLRPKFVSSCPIGGRQMDGADPPGRFLQVTEGDGQQGIRNRPSRCGVIWRELVQKGETLMRLRLGLVAVLTMALLAACASPVSPEKATPVPEQQPAVPKDVPTDSNVPESKTRQNPITGTVRANVPPRPAVPFIRDVAFATAERGWILLDGEALETRDGGETWRPAVLPQPFESMSFPTPNLGYATVQQHLFRTTDGAATWVPLDTTGWPNHNAFFLDERNGWSSGLQQDAFFRTQDGGRTWERLSDPCPSQSRRPFSFISPTAGWLLCGFDEGSGAMSKRLYRTNDGGLTWTLLGEALVGKNGELAKGKEWPAGLGVGDYVSDLFFADENHGWYTGARYGSFMATQDGGRTWQQATGASLQGSRVRFVIPQVGYRSGLDTLQTAPWVLTMTRDRGETWQQVFPRRQPLQRFYLDAQTYIGELNCDLYRSSDAGGSWQLLGRLPACPDSISYTSREHAWALTFASKHQPRRLYRSTDGGVTWKPVSYQGDLGPFQYVQGLDGDTAVLWDNANRLLMTQDGGNSFTPVAAPYDQSGGHGFFFASTKTGWFSRNFGLFSTSDGGTDWDNIALPENWKAQGVTLSPDGRVWASIADTSDHNTPVLLTLASDDGGKTWTRYDLGDFNQPGSVYRCGLSSICIDSGGSRDGIVSHDDGQTWRYYQR